MARGVFDLIEPSSKSQREEFEVAFSDPSSELWQRLRNWFQWGFGLILGVVIIGFATMLLMTAGLVIDAWNYRNTVAKDNRNFEVQTRLIEQNILMQEQMTLQLKQIKEEILKQAGGTQ